MSNYTIYFAHGKESGPWGTKIVRLADIAKEYGVAVISPDYSDTFDPDVRVERLLSVCDISSEHLILVGSSMGGYVSTVASERLKPKGLFLMAPAFYIGDYQVQDPVPYSDTVDIIHGWNDDIVPCINSIKFAEKYKSNLHLIDSGHTLNDSLDQVCGIFKMFLGKIL